MKRAKLTSFTLSIMFLVFLVSFSSVVADETDGDSKLCGDNLRTSSSSMGSDSSIPTYRLQIISRCDIVNLETHKNHSEKFVAFLKEMDDVLWNSGRLPKVLYHYSLTVNHDDAVAIELNLSNWNFNHSPYSAMSRSFVYKLPACSQMIQKLYSPWPPRAEESSVNVGKFMKSGIWMTEAYGRRASILTPIWSNYFADGFSIKDLPLSETKTTACKKLLEHPK